MNHYAQHFLPPWVFHSIYSININCVIVLIPFVACRYHFVAFADKSIMGQKPTEIGRLTSNARKTKAARATETSEQRAARNEANRLRNALNRASETSEQREARKAAQRARTAQARLSETCEQREARLEANRIRTAQSRLYETSEQREARNKAKRDRMAKIRSAKREYWMEILEKKIRAFTMHTIAFNRYMPLKFKRLQFPEKKRKKKKKYCRYP